MTATVDAPAAKATPTEIADLMLLSDLMGELERFTDLVEKHDGRPYTSHLRGILNAYCDTVEFMAAGLPGEAQVSA